MPNILTPIYTIWYGRRTVFRDRKYAFVCNGSGDDNK